VAVTQSISVVDDDESVRIAMVGLLRSLGYRACAFASAEEFLGCGDVHAFDCLITDIQMPGMSGMELQQHLAEVQCSLPVIMITARPDPVLEQKALAAGALSVIRKPFEAAALIDLLRTALNG
jgi:FixJ family two-component response regulator